MRSPLSFVLTALLSVGLSSSVQATIIHVPADSTTIQGGIDGASTGDTVMVAPGTYHEYEIDFLGKAIVVMGTDPEDSAVVASTVVNANEQGSVFIFRSGEGPSSMLAGLTLINGSAFFAGGGIRCENGSSPRIWRNFIVRNWAGPRSWDTVFPEGGGISCDDSSPLITDNIIADNTVWGHDFEISVGYGGGIACTGTSDPWISNNVISGNLSGATGAEIWGNGNGGGIYIGGSSSPIITDNLIADNTVHVEWGIGAGGGILLNGNGNVTIERNVISGNDAAYGGGIGNTAQGSASIAHNIIENNHASKGGGIYYELRQNDVLANNTIRNNSASSNGGGIYVAQCISLVLSNNTFTGNSAASGGGFGCYGSYVQLFNTIFWGDSAEVGKELLIGSSSYPSAVTIDYSDVEGGMNSVSADPEHTIKWGQGMIDADPFFISRFGFDYLLRPGSPCIDAGDPSVEDGINWPAWYPNGSRSDMGAYGGPDNTGWLH